MAIKTRCVAAALIWSFLVAHAFAAEPLEVGKYSCPNHLEVVGTKEVSAGDLAAALANDSEVAWAGHPSAPLVEYRATICRRAEIALKHLGFPKPQVETGLDAKAERVIVEIVEGPRYRSGEVRVTGGGRETAGRIEAALLKEHSPEDAILMITDTPDGGSVARWVNCDGNPVSMQSPSWKVGAPTPFDTATWKVLGRQIQRSFEEVGHFDSVFSLSISGDSERGLAHLLVNVTKDGTPAKIAEIKVEGCEKNTRDEVLAFLGISSDEPFLRQDRAKLEYKLRSSGRFLSQHVKSRLADSGKGLVVTVELKEYALAPPLSQPLSREEQALLRCRNWLLQIEKHGYDLKCQYRRLDARDAKDGAATEKKERVGSAFPECEMVFSRDGFLVAVGPEPARRVTCLASREQVGCFLPGDARKFLVPVGGAQQLTVNLDWRMNDGFGDKDKPDEKPFHFQFGAGLHTPVDHDTRLPIKLDIRCEPVLAIATAHEGAPRFEWNAEILTIRYDSRSVRIDAESGRLLEVIDVENGDEFRVMSEKNYLARRIAQLKETPGKNAYDPARPVGSLFEFTGSEPMLRFIQECWPATANGQEAAIVVTALQWLSQSARDNTLPSVDKWVQAWIEMHENEIVIPAGGNERPPNVVRYVARYGLLATDQLFERDTWPSTLGRLTSCLAAGEMKFFLADMSSLAASEKIGPLGCLIIASLSPNPTVATLFAQKGGERLTLESFRRDAELLTQVLSRMESLEFVVGAARAMMPEQAGEIARYFEMDDKGAAELVRLLRAENSTKAAVTALPQVLESLWKQGLETEVAAALRKFDSRVAQPDSPAIKVLIPHAGQSGTFFVATLARAWEIPRTSPGLATVATNPQKSYCWPREV